MGKEFNSIQNRSQVTIRFVTERSEVQAPADVRPDEAFRWTAS